MVGSPVRRLLLSIFGSLSILIAATLVMAPNTEESGSGPRPGSSPGESSAETGSTAAVSTIRNISIRERAQRQSVRSRCGNCHELSNGLVDGKSHPLHERASLGQETWAKSARLEIRCGSCHASPPAEALPTEAWREAIIHMSTVMHDLNTAPGFQPTPRGREYKEWLKATYYQWQDVVHYYFTFSDSNRIRPPDPPVSGRTFEPRAIGLPVDSFSAPTVSNLNVVQLEPDRPSEILVTDFSRSDVALLTPSGGGWKETSLDTASFPARTSVADLNADGLPDIIVPELGSMYPTNEKVGSLRLLMNQGSNQFKGITVLDDVGRVADARPGDFDNDGDLDLVVAIFGWTKVGQIGWLEQLDSSMRFRYHSISGKTGTIHVPTVDLNGDGLLDFVALISQEHEEIAAFLNEGDGSFSRRRLFFAGTPSFGLSGLSLADLDQDGDQDVLFTNGDAFDIQAPLQLPYHGVHWLENQNGQFEYRHLLWLYGAYSATPGDVDGDGDLDIAAVSLANRWQNPNRKSLLWLENDGRAEFTPHGVSNQPTHLVTVEIADLTGDGSADLLTGSLYSPRFSSKDHRPVRRSGRITLWENPGSPDSVEQ